MKEITKEQQQAQGTVMEIYTASAPVVEELYERAYINHVAWSVVVVALGVILWMGLALINAENQRNALYTKQCADPVFKGEIDKACLRSAHSREHWWQHLTYAMAHISPQK